MKVLPLTPNTLTRNLATTYHQDGTVTYRRERTTSRGTTTATVLKDEPEKNPWARTEGQHPELFLSNLLTEAALCYDQALSAIPNQSDFNPTALFWISVREDRVTLELDDVRRRQQFREEAARQTRNPETTPP